MADNEIGIRSVGVPYGWPQSRRRTESGYVLENGIVLLDSERDADGRYYGGAGMDGMFLRAPYPNRLFSPSAIRTVLSGRFAGRNRNYQTKNRKEHPQWP